VSTIFALGAAFWNAVFAATQHVGSTSGRAASASGLRLVVQLFRSPLWLFGWAAAIAGFVFQALALNNGQLSIVQALLVTELVFMLVLRRIWIRQTIRPVAWGSAALTCIGLAAFLIIDQPRGGVQTPTPAAWTEAVAVFGGATLLITLAARRGGPKRRAALYGTAAAIAWALEAVFIKSATHTLSEAGVVPVLTHWQVYALAVSAILGTVLMQAALHAGPLSVSQPMMVVVNPCVSVGLSVWLYQERYTQGAAAAAGSILGFIVMCVGVVLLTQTTPSTMTATTPSTMEPSRVHPTPG
jgi:hypothetical protein